MTLPTLPGTVPMWLSLSQSNRQPLTRIYLGLGRLGPTSKFRLFFLGQSIHGDWLGIAGYQWMSHTNPCPTSRPTNRRTHRAVSEALSAVLGLKYGNIL